MISINLLPDVKREYLKAQQMKHAVVIGAALVTVSMLSITVLLFVYVRVLQPQHRANVQKDIDSGIAEVKGKTDAVKIATVQGALEQLPALQDKKLYTSRVFGYLTSFTPEGVSYSEIKLDTASGTLTLTGTTSSYERANVLANNLKSAQFTYKQNDAQQQTAPFSNVVFNSLSRQESSDLNKNVGFELSVQVAPVVFDQAISDQKLVVNSSSEKLLLPDAKPFEGGAQ